MKQKLFTQGQNRFQRQLGSQKQGQPSVRRGPTKAWVLCAGRMEGCVQPSHLCPVPFSSSPASCRPAGLPHSRGAHSICPPAHLSPATPGPHSAAATPGPALSLLFPAHQAPSDAQALCSRRFFCLEVSSPDSLLAPSLSSFNTYLNFTVSVRPTLQPLPLPVFLIPLILF